MEKLNKYIEHTLLKQDASEEELIKLLMTKRFIKVGIKFKLIAFTASLILIVILCLSFLVLGGIKNNQTKQVEDILFNQKDMFEQYFSERVNSSSNNQKYKQVSYI